MIIVDRRDSDIDPLWRQASRQSGLSVSPPVLTTGHDRRNGHRRHRLEGLEEAGQCRGLVGAGHHDRLVCEYILRMYLVGRKMLSDLGAALG